MAELAAGPSARGTWHAARVAHVDLRPLPPASSSSGGNSSGGMGEGALRGVAGAPEGGLWGLVAADRYPAGGAHHFLQREAWWVSLKAQLRALAAAQLGLVLTAAGVAALAAEAGAGGRAHAHARADAEGGDGEGGPWGKGHFGAQKPGLLAAALRRAPAVAALARALVHGAGGAWAAAAGAARRCEPSPDVRSAAAVAAVAAVAAAAALGIMVAAPGAVPCPRWAVAVNPLPRSAHYVPPQ